jgi:hypothetical protein
MDEGSPAVRFENAATRALEQFRAAWEARDWDGVCAGAAAGCRQIDRRGIVQLDLDRDQHLQWLRMVFEMPSSHYALEVLATRGDRLALYRGSYEATDHVAGPSDAEWLGIIEVSPGGERIAAVLFDPDDLDAAWAELDARYGAGEAAPYAAAWEKWVRHTRAIAARDWEQLASVFVSDLVVEDHRPIGVLAVRSRDEYVASVRALVELRPDARLRVWHALALDDRRALTMVRWEGDEAEGAFDINSVVVTDYGPDGLRRREDLYGLDQLDAARARYAELAEPAAATP